jgi:hypothetical protein
MQVEDLDIPRIGQHMYFADDAVTVHDQLLDEGVYLRLDVGALCQLLAHGITANGCLDAITRETR